MGYDCTFHLVDERAIRETFVPHLLGQHTAPTPLDRIVPDAPALWDSVRTALRKEKPDTAASLLCQLAITFSACSLSHHYERGFALSLWQDQEDDVAVEFPHGFAFSPEPLFEKVVQHYPALHRRFPTWFTGNYSTGVFIPSPRVPEVLAWVEQQVETFAKGDRRQFKGLLRILRTAAAQNLAYWEATDLAIPMADQYAGAPDLMTAGFFGNEPTTPAPRLEEAPLTAHVGALGDHIIDHFLLSGDARPFQTSLWDLSVWPPVHLHTLPEFATRAARSRDGQWLLLSETRPDAKPRTFRPRLFTAFDRTATGDFPVLLNDAPRDLDAAAFFANRPVVFLRPPGRAKVGDMLPPPLWLVDGKWQPVPGLPAAPARPSALAAFISNPVTGAVRLPGGEDVLIWDGDGYELHDGKFQKTFPMAARNPEQDFTSAPAGDDGFFYLSNRCLFEIHRGGTPQPHALKWTNIMFIRPGPPGAILLQEGDNKDGDVGKLYFPADGTFIHVEPELFDDGDYKFIYWSASDRFVVLHHKFLAIPTATVLALPRHSAATGRRVKP